MIIQEQISDTLVKTYSDNGVYIHGGYPEADYAKAIDPISMGRTYEETDIQIPIEVSENNPQEMKEALQILLNIN